MRLFQNYLQDQLIGVKCENPDEVSKYKIAAIIRLENKQALQSILKGSASSAVDSQST